MLDGWAAVSIGRPSYQFGAIRDPELADQFGYVTADGNWGDLETFCDTSGRLSAPKHPEHLRLTAGQRVCARAAGTQFEQQLMNHGPRHDRFIGHDGGHDPLQALAILWARHIADSASSHAIEHVFYISPLREHDDRATRGGTTDSAHGRQAVAGDVATH